MAAARAAAERGEHAEAARILEGGREAMRRSAAGGGGGPDVRRAGGRAGGPRRPRGEPEGVRADGARRHAGHAGRHELAQAATRLVGGSAAGTHWVSGPRRPKIPRGTAAVRDSGDAEHGEDLAERARSAATNVVASAAGEKGAFRVCKMIYCSQTLGRS